MRKRALLIISLAVFIAVVAAAAALVDVGAPPPPLTTPVAPLPGTPEIDLLALVEPDRDAVQGAWKREEGRLVSDDGPASRLELPYFLPEEYNFTIEFVRRSGKDAVVQILARGDKPFLWRTDGELEIGRVHTSTIEVRKDRVTVHVDNRKVLVWKPGDRDLGMSDDWRLRREPLPGLGTSGSSTEFRKIRLFEVTGQGRSLRPRGK